MTTDRTHASAFTGTVLPSADVIAHCMHCGLCLPTCPTYQITGLERSSPRGRIRLIKAVADGDLPLTPEFAAEMNFCLDCQACETACPAGVRYGSLVEAARAQAFELKVEPASSRWIKRVFIGWIFRRQELLKIVARMLRLYQRSGLAWFLERSGWLRMLAPQLARLQPLAPEISSSFTTDHLDEFLPAYGPSRHRVAFLTGCLMDVAFADVNRDTIELLRRHGCDVVVPPGQSCCGSLAAHNGDVHSGRAMAENLVRLFSEIACDAIVMNSAGCGAFVKEYGHHIDQGHPLHAAAARIAAKTLDVTEFLLQIGFTPTAQRPDRTAPRVAYHEACHLVHSQKVSAQPRALLSAIPGITLVELPEATWCCGSAGIYNITQHDDAMVLLERKVDNIASVSPDVIVTGNPGCMLQIQHGLRQRGMKVRLVHTATFLRESCEA